MPFESDKQRRFMWAKHPEIAQKWSNEGKGYVKGRRKESKAVEGLKRAHK